VQLVTIVSDLARVVEDRRVVEATVDPRDCPIEGVAVRRQVVEVHGVVEEQADVVRGLGGAVVDAAHDPGDGLLEGAEDERVDVEFVSARDLLLEVQSEESVLEAVDLAAVCEQHSEGSVGPGGLDEGVLQVCGEGCFGCSCSGAVGDACE